MTFCKRDEKAGKFPEFVAVHNKSQLWQQGSLVFFGRFERDVGEVFLSEFLSFLQQGVSCCGILKVTAGGSVIFSGKIAKNGGGFP
jgi:hypothetical protein